MNNRVIACIGSALAAAGLLLIAPIAADAQQQASTPAEAPVGGLEEIVVTAQRRSEKAVDVPISITALSQEQLETANVQNLGDITKLTPALRFDNQTGFSQPTIRGIGTGITTSGGGSNVGIYIDGFYSPNPLASDFQLLDVTNIQVLKGPQGTLFGHNTTGGAILVTTAEPSVDPHAEAKVSYGRFDSQKYQAYATGGYRDRGRGRRGRLQQGQRLPHQYRRRRQPCRRLRELDGPHRPQVPVHGQGVGAVALHAFRSETTRPRRCSIPTPTRASTRRRASRGVSRHIPSGRVYDQSQSDRGEISRGYIRQHQHRDG